MNALRASWCIGTMTVMALAACGKVRDGTDNLRSPPNGSETGGRSDGGANGGASGSGTGTSGGRRSTNGGSTSGTGSSGSDGDASSSAGASEAGGTPGSGGFGETGATSGTGGDADSGAGGTNTGGANTGGMGGAGGSDAATSIPPDILKQKTVWVGEAEFAVTYPATVQGSKEPEKVMLVLDAITSSVTGTVAFGEGPQPAPDPSNIYPTWTTADGTFPTLPDNWLYAPFPGFPYTIISSELKGDRLSLNFAPVEVFAGTCAAQLPGTEPGVQGYCECTLTECHGRNQPLRRLDLVVAGSTMSGEMTRPSGNWLGGVPSIRLTRIQ